MSKKRNFKNDNKMLKILCGGRYLRCDKQDLERAETILCIIKGEMKKFNEMFSTKGDTYRSKQLVNALNSKESKKHLKKLQASFVNIDKGAFQYVYEIECSQKSFDEIINQFEKNYKDFMDVSSSNPDYSFLNCFSLCSYIMVLISALQIYYYKNNLQEIYDQLMSYTLNLTTNFVELKFTLDKIKECNS